MINFPSPKNFSKEGSPQPGDSPSIVAPPRNLRTHQLQNAWTLWRIDQGKNQSWENMLRSLGSFSTVEDFWSLYWRIEPPSKLKNGSDYFLFKSNIQPMWEDPANKEGGRWLIALQKGSTNLDAAWLDMLLCLIGEVSDHSDQICGGVVRIRKKGDKISLWTNNGKDEEAVLEIGHKIRQVVSLEFNQRIQYQEHMKEAIGSGLMHFL
ncbi:eukaryotic translation initiation factor 4E1 [Drosophila ficusphila]|uniref:eukaryotic translation initiation factor 4E1 n=1 Tax=Drosophila ficusphila TaxID=30025 RepID=UPI0007E60ECB|nr:eukaryotic translation initiation factor 4E1 [Drosophila ficusphila]